MFTLTHNILVFTIKFLTTTPLLLRNGIFHLLQQTIPTVNCRDEMAKLYQYKLSSNSSLDNKNCNNVFDSLFQLKVISVFHQYKLSLFQHNVHPLLSRLSKHKWFSLNNLKDCTLLQDTFK